MDIVQHFQVWALFAQWMGEHYRGNRTIDLIRSFFIERVIDKTKGYKFAIDLDGQRM